MSNWNNETGTDKFHSTTLTQILSDLTNELVDIEQGNLVLAVRRHGPVIRVGLVNAMPGGVVDDTEEAYKKFK